MVMEAVVSYESDDAMLRCYLEAVVVVLELDCSWLDSSEIFGSYSNYQASKVVLWTNASDILSVVPTILCHLPH